MKIHVIPICASLGKKRMLYIKK